MPKTATNPFVDTDAPQQASRFWKSDKGREFADYLLAKGYTERVIWIFVHERVFPHYQNLSSYEKHIWEEALGDKVELVEAEYSVLRRA